MGTDLLINSSLLHKMAEIWHIVSLFKFFHFTTFLMTFIIKKQPSPGWMGMTWTRNPSSVSSYLALKISLPSSTRYTSSLVTNSFSLLSVCSAYSLSEDDSSSLMIELPGFSFEIFRTWWSNFQLDIGKASFFKTSSFAAIFFYWICSIWLNSIATGSIQLPPEEKQNLYSTQHKKHSTITMCLGSLHQSCTVQRG